jgi:glycosyltransferase involved in cell wall biosynthesis
VVEVLGEGVHLAKIDDIDAVVDSIYRLRSNFDEWKTYSERIRKRAGDYFSPEYLCPKLIEMYDDVLQSRQGGGL